MIPQPRDFLETTEGLAFAVVETGIEDDRAIGFLRYRRAGGIWRKLNTHEANDWLARHHPEYLFHCPRRDARFHGVFPARVIRHHQPKSRVQQLLRDGGHDAIERAALEIIRWLDGQGIPAAHLGLTGSLLISAQRAGSDVDLVIYGKKFFHAARDAVRCGLDNGALEPLSDALWHDAWARRGCSLTEAQYRWHDARKFNKASWGGLKFDLSLADDAPPGPPPGSARKRGVQRIVARVVDDTNAFAHPARYRIDHPAFTEVFSFTPTYAGQARTGEWVEITGRVEDTDHGARLVVGMSREAPDEFIRVCPDPEA